MKRLALLIIVVALPFLFACKEKLVKYKDSGTTVHLMVDQTLKVELPGDAGSSNAWRELRYDNVVLLRKGKGNGNYVLGSGDSEYSGNYFFRFRAMVPGETKLYMEYGHKYDSGKKPSKIFEIDVVVVPKQ